MVKKIIGCLLFCISCVQAEDRLNLAVTSSFKPVIDALAEPFFDSTGIKLNISSASTGVLYQQIISGAPFDVFFAADTERPQTLVKKLGLPPENAKTYAIGQLVLVSWDEQVVSIDDLKDYKGRVIIANPAHAPYGEAAKQVLDAVLFTGDTVLATNVTQARQYLDLKLANVGLIAASVAVEFSPVVVVDQARYDAIEQQAVIVNPSAKASAFFDFLQSPPAIATLQALGYLLPDKK